MGINIVVAEELQLARKGIVSLINNMSRSHAARGASGFHSIVDTGSTNELVTLLASQHTDLLILGYSLNTLENGTPISTLDGYGLIKWLARRYPKLKIIVISPYKHSAIMRAILDMGATGYITMNCCEKTLEQAITAVLNNEIYVENGLMKALFKGGDLSGKEMSLREMEVLRLLLKGFSFGRIAEQMNLSPKTVSAHKLRAMSKLEVNSDCELFCLLSQIRLFNPSF